MFRNIAEARTTLPTVTAATTFASCDCIVIADRRRVSMSADNFYIPTIK